MEAESNLRTLDLAHTQYKHAADLALAQRVQQREEAAMREVYDAIAGPLTSFARSCLGDPNDAADIVHETLLELWNRPERYQGRASLKSWLFAIARFKSIDRNRKSRRTVYTDQEPEIVDDAPSARDVLELSQNKVAVRAAVASLGDNHRRAVHMSFFENLTYREIAEVEGIPVGTIKTRILHAKKLLRHALHAHNTK